MALDSMDSNEKTLYDNLVAILNGTFKVGMHLMSLGGALKAVGGKPGWKARAIAAYLEQNDEAVGLLAGSCSQKLAARLREALEKRAG
jgi:hypothetical protein